MDDKELADKINELYTKYADVKIISKKFGISVAKVREYVKIARLAESLKDEVGVIKIPLDEIDEDCDSTRTSPPDTLKDLIEHIAQHGLLEPIVVCKDADGNYKIEAGLRRYCAYVVLNKNHPGEGWDKIPARSDGNCPDGHEYIDYDSSDSPTIDAK